MLSLPFAAFDRGTAEIRSATFQSFHNLGYVVTGPFHSPLLLEQVTEVVEAIQADADGLPDNLKDKLLFERVLPSKKRGGLSSEDTGNAIFIIGDAPAFNPCFAKIAIEPALIEKVTELLGTEDILYHFCNVTMKRSRIGSGISWHRDFPNKAICPSTSSFLRVMLCLDGMDSENGATEFVEGSHFIPDETAITASSAEEASRAEAKLQRVECRAGEVVFIHPKSVHGGSPNTSNRHRRNVIVQWGRASDPVSPRADCVETLTNFSITQIRKWIDSAEAQTLSSFHRHEYLYVQERDPLFVKFGGSNANHDH